MGDLLDKGEIDFLMTANNPLSFRRGSPNVRRLFPDYAKAEKDYFRRTRIYPIMHTVVIRREIYDRDPWVAISLYKAFLRAKDYAFRLISETGSPKASFAWLQPLIEEEQSIIGKDWYPYGIEANRPTIEALLQYTYEQGLSDRRLSGRGTLCAEHAARHSAQRGPTRLTAFRRLRRRRPQSQARKVQQILLS